MMENVNRNARKSPHNSEALRLASLRKQKQAFKEKEQLVRNALKCVDGITPNKKVKFDDDIIESYEKNVESKKNQLFDDDEDDDQNWSEGKLNFDENCKPKALNIGNDARFTMDKRFLEDDEKEESGDVQVNKDADGFKDEKNRELEILENMLGKPMMKKDMKHITEKRTNKMVRYDPSGYDHLQHELQAETERTVTKKKRKINEAEVAEEAPIPVSSEIFFSVSDTLTESLKVQEEFSMLRTFGADITDDSENKYEERNQYTDGPKQSNLEYKLPAKNPFKYDSTDDEDENFGKGGSAELMPKDHSKGKEKSYNSKETFFFALNDVRFKNAEDFFKIESASNEKFNKQRRELKQIVRAKVRNNTRKNQPRKNKIQTMKSKSR